MIVKMYQSTDGSLFKTFEEYQKHEETISIQSAVNAATLDHTDTWLPDGSTEYVISVGEVGGFIAKNAEVLRKILNDSAIVKRGRKSKQSAQEVEKLAA